MNQTRDKGFTLIELMLAMGFVSALLLAIAMTVIQIGNIYNTGLTYKNVNQTGGVLASEIQRSISGSAQFDISTNASGEGEHYVNKSWGGRLCLGQYSYIWNYGDAIQANNPLQLNMYSGATSTTPNINFIKVRDPDPNSSYCTAPLSLIQPSGATELLDVGQYNLAIHSFSITSDPTNGYDSLTGQRLYNISFLLGTNDQAALSASGDRTKTTCTTPDQLNADPSYCAVNRFDILARAGNRTAK